MESKCEENVNWGDKRRKVTKVKQYKSLSWMKGLSLNAVLILCFCITIIFLKNSQNNTASLKDVPSSILALRWMNESILNSCRGIKAVLYCTADGLPGLQTPFLLSRHEYISIDLWQRRERTIQDEMRLRFTAQSVTALNQPFIWVNTK